MRELEGSNAREGRAKSDFNRELLSNLPSDRIRAVQ